MKLQASTVSVSRRAGKARDGAHNFVRCIQKRPFRTVLLTRYQVAVDTIDVDVYEQREGFGLVRRGEAVERRRGAASNCGLNLRLDPGHAAEFDFE